MKILVIHEKLNSGRDYLIFGAIKEQEAVEEGGAGPCGPVDLDSSESNHSMGEKAQCLASKLSLSALSSLYHLYLDRGDSCHMMAKTQPSNFVPEAYYQKIPSQSSMREVFVRIYW
jgi:hypothetical protein